MEGNVFFNITPSNRIACRTTAKISNVPIVQNAPGFSLSLKVLKIFNGDCVDCRDVVIYHDGNVDEYNKEEDHVDCSPKLCVQPGRP